MFYLCLVLKSNAPPGPINNDINSVKFNEDILDFREETKLPAVHMYIYFSHCKKHQGVKSCRCVLQRKSNLHAVYTGGEASRLYIVEIFRLHFTVQT
jgi:hypothetical protein